jgi:superfamily II DNA/RNA helicase
LFEAHISDGYLRTLRRSINVGNLSAFFQSSRNENPSQTSSMSTTMVENKIPKSISNLLDRYVNKRLQTTLIPSMFADADLLAITKNSDETTMALLIAAVGLTMQEQVQSSEPLILIFTRTLETVKKIEALIRMFNGILQKDGIHIDLGARIIVGLVGQFSSLNDDQRMRFRFCKYAIFDQFDKLIRLGPINGLYDIFNNRCQSNQLVMKVFSGEFSVYEKLLSMQYLRKDHHFFNSESSEDLSNNFSNVQQYFEMKNLGKDRKQSLIEVLQQISNVDISSTYTIVIFFNDNDAALQIAYQNLILDLPNIVQQVFCKKTFTNNFDSVMYWAKVEKQSHPIFLTNDARDLQNG